MMNDKLQANAALLQFIIHHSAFILSFILSVPAPQFWSSQSGATAGNGNDLPHGKNVWWFGPLPVANES